MSIGEKIGVRSRRPLVASLLLCTAFLAGLVVWLYNPPVRYGSLPFWVGSVLLGLPFYVFAEWFSSLGLEMRFLAKIGRGWRIGFGVLWVVFCGAIFVLIALFLTSLVQL